MARDTLELTINSPTGGRVHIGDVGTVLNFVVTDGADEVDLTGYDTLTLLTEDPSGTAAEETLEFTTDGTDGALKLTTASDTFDSAGRWMVQALLGHADAGITVHTCIVYIRVYPNLVDPA
jgi:hypothetical protein